MFSVDYPFESSDEAGNFMDTMALSDKARADVASHNAERILGVHIN